MWQVSSGCNYFGLFTSVCELTTMMRSGAFEGSDPACIRDGAGAQEIKMHIEEAVPDEAN
jgi:hypothetical protein